MIHCCEIALFQAVGTRTQEHAAGSFRQIPLSASVQSMTYYRVTLKLDRKFRFETRLLG